MPFPVTSFPVMPFPVILFSVTPFPVTSFPVTPFPVTSCSASPPCDVMTFPYGAPTTGWCIRALESACIRISFTPFKSRSLSSGTDQLDSHSQPDLQPFDNHSTIVLESFDSYQIAQDRLLNGYRMAVEG